MIYIMTCIAAVGHVRREVRRCLFSTFGGSHHLVIYTEVTSGTHFHGRGVFLVMKYISKYTYIQCSIQRFYRAIRAYRACVWLLQLAIGGIRKHLLHGALSR